MSPLRNLALAVPFVLAATAGAQSVTLRFKPTVGTTKSYVTTTTMTMVIPGMPANMGGATKTITPMSMRAVSRSGNKTTMESKTGKVTVVSPPNSPTASMKDMMEKQASFKTTTSVIDELGNVSGMAQAGNPGMGQMGSSMMQGAQGLSYPTKALKVGDTWGGTLDFGKIMSGVSKAGGMGATRGMSASGKIPISYRLTNIDKRGGKTLATVTMTMIGTANMSLGNMAPGKTSQIKMHVVGTMIVDTSTGMLVSSTTTSDSDTAMMGTTMKQHMVMTMKAQ